MGRLTITPSRPTSRTNYPYATARVRAKKAQLLPREAYLKMLKMSIPEITQQISETVYQKEVDELAQRFSGIDLIEGALNLNEEHTYSQIRGFTGGEAHALVAAFLRRHEYHAIKVILRGKHHGATREEMLRELLIEDKEDYEFLSTLMTDEIQGVNGVLEALKTSKGKGRGYYLALQQAEKLSAEPGLSEYEDALDRAYYQELLATLRVPGRPGQEANARFLMERYVRLEIDVVNLLTALRYRKNDLDWDSLRPQIIPGGSEFKEETLKRIHAAETTEEVKKEVSGSKFGDSLDEGLDAGSLPRVEIAAQKRLMNFASGFSHMIPLSILPIIDFLLRKHTEVRNLRAVARGKEARLGEDTIQQILII
jgi:V/A-type H+/Na+-transporting ATPase subunit C